MIQNISPASGFSSADWIVFTLDPVAGGWSWGRGVAHSSHAGVTAELSPATMTYLDMPVLV